MSRLKGQPLPWRSAGPSHLLDMLGRINHVPEDFLRLLQTIEVQIGWPDQQDCTGETALPKRLTADSEDAGKITPLGKICPRTISQSPNLRGLSRKSR